MKKICKKCQQEKSLDQYYKQANGVMGVRARCKACVIGENTERAKQQRAGTFERYQPKPKVIRSMVPKKLFERVVMQTPDEILSIERKCSTCGEMKPLGTFAKGAMGRFSRGYRCKPCTAKSTNKYYYDNRDSMLEYRRENADRIREYIQNYNKENRDKYIESSHRVRAQEAGVHIDIHTGWYEELMEKYTECLACGSTEALTVDHIIPLSKNGPHTWDNLQVLCKSCNSSKNNRDYTDHRIAV